MARGLGSHNSIPLLPFRFRLAGYTLTFLSLGAAYLYFFGGRPALFEVPVFAILTSYAETRWFVIAQTNALDEIAVIFAVLGLLFILFSREQEENEKTLILRIKSLFLSVYLTSVFIILFYITVFGWPVFILISLSFILFLLISIISFKIYLIRYSKIKSNQ
ncbi:MAG: hypothetical protein GVY07_09450 [Bacteroidetes bacterium]|jgi:amino acid transporter|nr:hypothetical protein [Bacteroidota bacterium]